MKERFSGACYKGVDFFGEDDDNILSKPAAPLLFSMRNSVGFSFFAGQP